MEENKLLEECVSITLTPLQTLILSDTVITISQFLEFLTQNSYMHIEKVSTENKTIPAYEQVGDILMSSAIEELKKIRMKIWENGKEQIGEEIPEEFGNVMGIYSTVLEGIFNSFIEMLFYQKGNNNG